MAELGYEPNFQASNLPLRFPVPSVLSCLRHRRTMRTLFIWRRSRGISHYCNAHQYISTIVTGQNEREILTAVRSMSRSGKVDGFIVLYSRVNDPVIDFLSVRDFSILIENRHSTRTTPSILITTTFWLVRKPPNISMHWATGRSHIWVSIIPWSFPQTEKQAIWRLF